MHQTHRKRNQQSMWPSSTNYPIITVYDAWKTTIFVLFAFRLNNKTINFPLSLFFFTWRIGNFGNISLCFWTEMFKGMCRTVCRLIWLLRDIVNFKAWTYYLSISNELLLKFNERQQFFLFPLSKYIQTLLNYLIVSHIWFTLYFFFSSKIKRRAVR